MLYNYVPVDGVEIGCKPAVWETQEVVSELQEALAANLGAVKFNGNYYRENDKYDDYFVVD